MRRRGRAHRLLAFGVVLTFLQGASWGELSVEEGSLQLTTGILLVNPEDPSPWPSFWSPVRLHVDPERLLNIDGDIREDGEPDFAFDAVSGDVDVVWSINEGGVYRIAHAAWSDGDWSQPQFLTDSASDDMEPRLSTLDGGGLGVTWWRDGATRSVFYSERVGATGPFGPEVQVSEPGEESLHPSVATAGSVTYVAYEEVGAEQRTVIVEKKTGTGPFVRDVISITSREACVDVVVHESGGNVWVDWIDSDSHMGWSRLTETGWDSPSFEPYAASGIDGARLTIKGKVIR